MKKLWFCKSLVYILTILLMFSNVAFGAEGEEDLIGGTGDEVVIVDEVVSGDDGTGAGNNTTGTVVSDENNSGGSVDTSGSGDNSGSDDVVDVPVVANVLSDEMVVLVDEDLGNTSTDYSIADAAALSEFMSSFNEGTFKTDGVNAQYITISLTGNSYDLSVSAYSSSWVGIGDSDTPFNLIFDGNGATITLPDGAFLFGTVTGTTTTDAEIKNVTIDDATTSTAGIGGLVDTASYLTISDCTNNGAITKNSSKGNNYGSMIAYVSGDCTLTNCDNNGNVTVDEKYTVNLGGLIGYVAADADADVSLTDCKNSGEITASFGSYVYAGGLIGFSSGGNTLSLSGCQNTKDISATSSSGPIYVGGMIGMLSGSASISGSTNTGAITSTTANSTNLWAGGLIGRAYQSSSSHSISISGSTNSGAISTAKSNDATGTVSEAWVGGLIGQASYCNLGSGAENTGSVSDTSGATISYLGGVIGKVDDDLKSYTTDPNKSEAIIYSPTNEGAISSNGATTYVGGLFGYLTKEITLDSAINSGNIDVDCTSDANVGGFVGKADAAVTITGTATNSGDIDVDSDTNAYVGGLLGYASAKFSTATATTTATNTGAISVTTGSDAAYTCVGGLLGYAYYGTDCYFFTNSGDITTSAAKGENAVGGVTGYLYYTGISTFKECFNSGIITANDSSTNSQSYAGGILGASCISNMLEYAIAFSNCGNMGLIYSDVRAGGIVGSSIGYITLTECFNGENINGDIYAGGLLGYVYNSVISYCYNFGMISAPKTSDCYAGGLAGGSDSSVNISYSYNTGVVSGGNAAGLVCNAPTTIYADEINITNSYNGGYVDGDSAKYGICPTPTNTDSGEATIENCYYLEQYADTDTAALSGTGAVATYDQMACNGAIEGSTIVDLLAGDSAGWSAGISRTPALPTLSSGYSGSNYTTYSAVSAAVVLLDIANKEILGYYPDSDEYTWDIDTAYVDGATCSAFNTDIYKYIYYSSDFSEYTDGTEYEKELTYTTGSSDQTITLSTITDYTDCTYTISETDNGGDLSNCISITDGVLTLDSDMFTTATGTDSPITFTVNYTTSGSVVGSIAFAITVSEFATGTPYTKSLEYAQYSHDQTIVLSTIVSASTYAFDTSAGDYTSNASYLSIEDGALTIKYNCFLIPTSATNTTGYTAPIDFTVTYTTSDNATGSINFTINVDKVDASDFVVSDWDDEPWSFDGDLDLKEITLATGSIVNLNDWTEKYTRGEISAGHPFGIVTLSVVNNYTDTGSFEICLGAFGLYLGTKEVTLGEGIHTLGISSSDVVYYLNQPTDSMDEPRVYYKSGIPFYVSETTTYQFGIDGEDYTITDDVDNRA